MIDLSTRAQELYSIKLNDGKILKLNKPTQKLLLKMMELQSYTNAQDALDAIYEVITDIFNKNVDGVVFTRTQLEDMLDLEITVIIIEDYLKSTVKQLGE